MLRHLEALQQVAQALEWPDWTDSAEMEAELASLGEGLQAWVDSAQELRDAQVERDRPNEERMEQLEARIASLEMAIETLEQQDLSGAIDNLQGVE